MYAWSYDVRPDMIAAFLAAYGPSGAWVELFEGSPGYVRTELHRDRARPTRFITLDYWTSAEAWDSFRRAQAQSFEALDKRCEALTLAEHEIGRFETVKDVPT